MGHAAAHNHAAQTGRRVQCTPGRWHCVCSPAVLWRGGTGLGAGDRQGDKGWHEPSLWDLAQGRRGSYVYVLCVCARACVRFSRGGAEWRSMIRHVCRACHVHCPCIMPPCRVAMCCGCRSQGASAAAGVGPNRRRRMARARAATAGARTIRLRELWGKVAGLVCNSSGMKLPVRERVSCVCVRQAAGECACGSTEAPRGARRVYVLYMRSTGHPRHTSGRVTTDTARRSH